MGGGGGRRERDARREEEAYENVRSALFMDSAEEHGRRLGHLSKPSRSHLYSCTSHVAYW